MSTNAVYFSPSSAHRLPQPIAQEIAAVREDLLHYPPFLDLIGDSIPIDTIQRVAVAPTRSLPGFFTITLRNNIDPPISVEVSSLDGLIYEAAQFMAGQDVPRPLFPPPSYESPQTTTTEETVVTLFKVFADTQKAIAKEHRKVIQALANNIHCPNTTHYHFNPAPFIRLTNSFQADPNEEKSAPQQRPRTHQSNRQ